VRQDDTWAWIAERLFEKMLRNGKVATFATAADAQHAADMHERDGCPNAPVLDDGLYWASTEPWEWWLHPNAVGDRPMEVFYT
jgi:hypothetical protein